VVVVGIEGAEVVEEVVTMVLVVNMTKASRDFRACSNFQPQVVL